VFRAEDQSTQDQEVERPLQEFEAFCFLGRHFT
jgi:hypothetical protein